MDKRERWIDCVKGVAICCVVMAHVNGREIFFYNWIYSFHIPIFFIVAGILFGVKTDWESEKMVVLLKRKVMQILYPYLTFSILTMVWTLVSRGRQSFLEVLRVTVLFEGYSALWFLPTLFAAEVIFILVYKSKIRMIGNLTLLGLLLVFGQERMDILGQFLNILTRSLIGSTFIVIGYWSYKSLGTIVGKKKYVVGAVFLLVALMFLSQINGFVDLHYSRISNPLYYYLFAIAGGYVIIVIMKFGIKSNCILEFFGKNSLIILATHLTLPGMGIFRALFAKIYSGLTWNPVSYSYDFFVFVCTMIFEVFLIICISKFLPFIVKPMKH